MNKKSSKIISRRGFIGTSTVALAGFTIVPGNAVSGLGHIAPSDKLNIAGIGIGGKGKVNLENVATTENIVALCDVDWEGQPAPVFKTYPNAKMYKDYRVMLDKQKDIDAVIIATPDHTHAVITMEAIRRGIHTYTEKPLTHTVHEARVLRKAAQEYKVATQMGNSGQASNQTRRLREMIWDGVIGPVHEVHVWTDRANNGMFRTFWPQGIDRLQETPPVPSGLDWDLFIGPAPMRPYHPAYHPFKFRAWLDFGTGALGDMGCHRMDPVFRDLKLKYPLRIEAVSTLLKNETYPLASQVKYEFPARGEMPPVTVYWYDGGLRPFRLEELLDGEKMGTQGTLYIGEKGKILDGKILSESLRNSYERPAPSIPSSPGHYMEWLLACKGETIIPGSSFEWAGPLTEAVLLGNIALRMELREKLTGQFLEYDAEKGIFSNLPEANEFIHKEYRNGWSL
jgi:predicted dehydrogenase